MPEPAPVAPVPAPPAALGAANSLPESAAAELPPPKFLIESPAASRRWMVAGIGIVAILGVLGAAFQIRDMWLPRVPSAFRPVPAAAPPVFSSALGLGTLYRAGHTQYSWHLNYELFH